MDIEVNLFASLGRYKPPEAGKDFWVISCPEGMTVMELINLLDVPREEVKLIFLNGVHATGETVLTSGDRIGLFPPVGGG